MPSYIKSQTLGGDATSSPPDASGEVERDVPESTCGIGVYGPCPNPLGHEPCVGVVGDDRYFVAVVEVVAAGGGELRCDGGDGCWRCALLWRLRCDIPRRCGFLASCPEFLAARVSADRWRCRRG